MKRTGNMRKLLQIEQAGPHCGGNYRRRSPGFCQGTRRCDTIFCRRKKGFAARGLGPPNGSGNWRAPCSQRLAIQPKAPPPQNLALPTQGRAASTKIKPQAKTRQSLRGISCSKVRKTRQKTLSKIQDKIHKPHCQRFLRLLYYFCLLFYWIYFIH